MAAVKPGDFITAKCGRCDDVTGHVVMLVLDGQVSKVECKACGSIHKYRETRVPGSRATPRESVRHVRAGQAREEGKDIGPSRSAPRTPARSGSAPKSAPRRAASAAKLESAWQEAMVRHSAERPLPYAMGNAYKEQDFVEHSVFGRGEVIKTSPPDKMDVLFQEGVKTLRCKI